VNGRGGRGGESEQKRNMEEGERGYLCRREEQAGK